MNKADLKQICRSCLEPAAKMYPLMGIILNVEVNIASMLSYCTNNELELNEGLPDSVCIPCFKTIRIAYNFLHQFKESQAKLQQQKSETQNELKDVQVDNKMVYDNANDEGEFHLSNENIEYVLEDNTNSNDADDTNYISYDLGEIHNYAGKSQSEEVAGISLEEHDKNTLDLVTGHINECDAEDCKPSVIEYVEDIDVKDNILNSSYAVTEEYLIFTADSVEETTILNPTVPNKKLVQKDDISYVNDYACPMCNATFQRLQKFHDHILVHNSNAIVCNKCPQQIRYNPLEYIQHFKDNHRYQCNICNRSLKSSYGFRYHMKHHENVRKYTCPVENCKKSYFLLHLLRKHMYTHSNTIKHTCNLCGANFRTYDTYKYHKKTHDGTRNYLCTICGKAFFQSVHLRDHTFRHTGYKRFTCDICGTSFTTNSQLTKHFRYCRKVETKRVKKEVD